MQSKYSAIAEFLGKTRQTISQFNHRCRFVALKDYQKSYANLGGA